MILRPAGAADAEALAGVHRLAFDTPWNAQDIAALMTGPGGFAVMVEVDGGAAGFVLCRAIAGEAEVLTLAVDPAFRRQGLARALMTAALDLARAAGAETMFLEVAADNAAAIGLYVNLSFIKAGLRRGYYGRGSTSAVDALILRRDLNT